jgi:hypothetical protein
MNAVDAMVFALLALADITLMVHLRRRRARTLRVKKMYHTLTLAVRRELAVAAPVSKVPARKQRALGAALLKRTVAQVPDLRSA